MQNFYYCVDDIPKLTYIIIWNAFALVCFLNWIDGCIYDRCVCVYVELELHKVVHFGHVKICILFISSLK